MQPVFSRWRPTHVRRPCALTVFFADTFKLPWPEPLHCLLILHKDPIIQSRSIISQIPQSCTVHCENARKALGLRLTSKDFAPDLSGDALPSSTSPPPSTSPQRLEFLEGRETATRPLKLAGQPGPLADSLDLYWLARCKRMASTLVNRVGTLQWASMCRVVVH